MTLYRIPHLQTVLSTAKEVLSSLLLVVVAASVLAVAIIINSTGILYHEKVSTSLNSDLGYRDLVVRPIR